MLDLVNLIKPMSHETNNEQIKDSANNTREFTKRFLRRRPIKQKPSLNDIEHLKNLFHLIISC